MDSYADKADFEYADWKDNGGKVKLLNEPHDPDPNCELCDGSGNYYNPTGYVQDELLPCECMYEPIPKDAAA